jgi:hypothetical protein
MPGNIPRRVPERITMSLTKPNAFLVNAASAMIIFLIAVDVARSGYQFGRFLAGL